MVRLQFSAIISFFDESPSTIAVLQVMRLKRISMKLDLTRYPQEANAEVLLLYITRKTNLLFKRTEKETTR